MIAAILFATAGLAVAAAVIDANDEEETAEQPEESSTPPGEEDSLTEEDGLTVATGEAEPERIDPETLEEEFGARVFEGTEEDETVYIDADTTSEFLIRLGSGGADTVVTGLGQSINTFDEETEGGADSADTVRLIYTPGQPEEVFERSGVRGSFRMDEEDTLEIEFPEGSGGTILPVYYISQYNPADACIIRLTPAVPAEKITRLSWSTSRKASNTQRKTLFPTTIPAGWSGAWCRWLSCTWARAAGRITRMTAELSTNTTTSPIRRSS